MTRTLTLQRNSKFDYNTQRFGRSRVTVTSCFGEDIYLTLSYGNHLSPSTTIAQMLQLKYYITYNGLDTISSGKGSTSLVVYVYNSVLREKRENWKFTTAVIYYLCKKLCWMSNFQPVFTMTVLRSASMSKSIVRSQKCKKKIIIKIICNFIRKMYAIDVYVLREDVSVRSIRIFFLTYHNTHFYLYKD